MPQFEPLKNDLLLRTARGIHLVSTDALLARKLTFQCRRKGRACAHVGDATGQVYTARVFFGLDSDFAIQPAGRYLPEYHEAKGKNDFFECCRLPEIASTLTLQPIERFAGLIDAAIIFSDILVIPQAMGMEVVMVDKKGPHFPNPLRSPEDQQYKEIMGRKVDVTVELDYVYKAITLTRQKLKGRVPLLGFCGAPWTLLSYMVEGGGSKMFKEVKTWIYKYSEESKALLQRISELCVEYLAHQVIAGAQVSIANKSDWPVQCLHFPSDGANL